MAYKKINEINFVLGDPYVQDSGEVYYIRGRYKFINELFWDYSIKQYLPFNKTILNKTIFGLVGKNQWGFWTYTDIKEVPKIHAKEYINYYRIQFNTYFPEICVVGEYIYGINAAVLEENIPLKTDQFDDRKQIYAVRYFNRYDPVANETNPESTHMYFKLSQEESPGKVYYDKKIYDCEKYSLKDYDDLKLRNFESFYRNKTKNLSEKFHLLNRILNKSIGVEFETNVGHLPVNTCKEIGVVPLKDGSIYGHEYVTLPYRDKVIDRLVVACRQMRYNVEIDTLCSTHVHVGNIERVDRTFIVSLYELWQYIQEEMYEIIVVNKRSQDYINNKKHGPKDHCKMLPRIYEKDINVYYKTIFKLLNQGQLPDKKYNRKTQLVHNGAQKWNIDCRYFNLNMIGLFENKGVIEFRIHGPTLNECKLVNYIFILNAIIEYAKKYSNIVLHRKEKLYLERIVNTIYKDHPLISKTLVNYIRERKSQYINNILTNNTWGNEIHDFCPSESSCLLTQFGYDYFDHPLYKEIKEYFKNIIPNNKYNEYNPWKNKVKVAIPNINPAHAIADVFNFNNIPEEEEWDDDIENEEMQEQEEDNVVELPF